MNIPQNVANIIDRRIDEAMNAEQNYCNQKVRKHKEATYDKIDAIKTKPLTKAGIAIVNAAIANNDIIEQHDIMSAADKKRVIALRKKHDGYETTQWRRRDKIRKQLTKLKVAVGADLELCNSRDEQRALLAKFKTHPLDKVWIIPKKPHTQPDYE